MAKPLAKIRSCKIRTLWQQRDVSAESVLILWFVPSRQFSAVLLPCHRWRLLVLLSQCFLLRRCREHPSPTGVVLSLEELLFAHSKCPNNRTLTTARTRRSSRLPGWRLCHLPNLEASLKLTGGDVGEGSSRAPSSKQDHIFPLFFVILRA